MCRLTALLAAFLLAAPAFANPCHTTSPSEAVASLAEQLAAGLQLRLDRSQPIVPTVFVSLDAITHTSSLGRILAEGTANALAGFGFTMAELRLRAESLAIHANGEFALTRHGSALASPVAAQAVLTGTYAPMGHVLYVNARLVHATSHRVLSTATCELVLTPAIRNALTAESRIPPVEPTATASLLNPKDKTDTRAIQSRLKELGLYHGRVDGIWGKGTQAAIEAFRRIRGLPQKGPWDLVTQSALFGS